MRAHLFHHEIYVSAITVIERVRGYGLGGAVPDAGKRERIEAARIADIANLGRVVAI